MTSRSLRRFARSLFSRAGLESEMDAEMRAHVEMETDELVRSGLSSDDARRQAMLAFGGIQQVKEDALDKGSIEWLENARRNIRIATRTLLRQRTFAITAILALALAIAVNTTVFSIVDAMINPRVGAQHPERLFEIAYFGDPRTKVDFAARDRAIDSAFTIYEGVTAWGFDASGTVEHGTRASDARATRVQPNFFAVMGMKPLLGRLAPGADDAGIRRSVVISARLRSELYSDAEQVIGSEITMEGVPRTVVGVIDRATSIEPLQGDMWSFADSRQRPHGRLVRLREGISADKARINLGVLAERLGVANGDTPHSTNFILKPIVEQFHAKGFHYALIGAGLAILLVACTNLANLQIARGLSRGPELALRGALGASQRQLVQQLLIESGVIAAAALVLALLLAIGGNAILRASIPRNLGEYIIEPQQSWRMVAAAGAAAVLCVIAIGLIPAIRVSRVDLNTLMKSRAGTGAHSANRRAYGVLVIAQIAFTLPLVSGAILLGRAALRLNDMQWIVERSGFEDPRNLIHVVVRPPQDTLAAQFPIGEASARFVERMRKVPGVLDAAVGYSAGTHGKITLEEQDGGTREEEVGFWSHRVVTPSYLRVSGLTVDRGTDFADGLAVGSAVIIDNATAGFLWPRSDALGRRIRFGSADSPLPMLPVVAMLHDPRTAERQKDDAERLQMPANHLGFAVRVMTLADSVPRERHGVSLLGMVKTREDPALVVNAIRADLRGFSIAPPNVQLYEDYLGIRKMREATEFIAGLFAVLGFLALGLSSLGIYGIVAQSVADRRREVAVRISLGATRRNIVHALLREGNVLLMAGIAIGLLFAAMTRGWIGLFLNSVDDSSAPFFALICLFVFGVMMIAALVPAFRASELDPMNVLRAE